LLPRKLSGVAAASSNFAILPSALTKEPYRVAIAIGALAAFPESSLVKALAAL